MNKASRRYAIGACVISFLVGLALLGFASEVEANAFPKIAKFMQLVGSFLTVSVVINLLYSAFIKPSDDAARKVELKHLLDEKIEEITVGKGKYGLSGFLDAIDFDALFSGLKHNQTLWWLDTYPLGVGTWTESLKKALASGAHVKMLVLDPASPNVAHRANELPEEYSPRRFKADIERFLSVLKSIDQGGLAGSLEVRLYDELIGLPLYIIEENGQLRAGYSGFFLCNPTGANAPHIKWGVGEDSILNTMSVYTHEKWQRNRNNIYL